jgi:hypothetical protein
MDIFNFSNYSFKLLRHILSLFYGMGDLKTLLFATRKPQDEQNLGIIGLKY